MHSFKQKVKEFKKKVSNSDSFNKIITKKNQFLDWVELHPWKTLGFIYLFFVFVKIAIYMLVSGSSPYTPDAFVYTRMARSFFLGNGFQIYEGIPSHQYPPLYPIAISPSFIFNDMVAVFNMIRIINAVITSLVIFPTYLLAREFMDIKKSMFISIIVSLMAGTFSYGFFALSENLLFPLFLFSIFFLYKSVYEKGYKFKILAGFFVGLCFLSKYTAVVFFPAMLLIFIFADFYKKYDSNSPNLIWILSGIKKWFITSIVAGMTVLPWLIRNGSLFGYNFVGILGYGSEVRAATKLITKTSSGTGIVSGEGLNLVKGFSAQIMIHNGFLILATGVIFFALGLLLLYKTFKEKNINLFIFGFMVFILVESFVLLTAWHNTAGGRSLWRLLARYAIPSLPLVVIYGYIAFNKLKTFRYVIYILIISIIPMWFLFKSESESFVISYINIIKYPEKYMWFSKNLQNFFETYNELLTLISFLLIAIIFFYFIIHKKERKKIILILSILLIISSSFFSITKQVTTGNLKSSNETYAIGKFLNSETSDNNKIVMIDQEIKSNKTIRRLVSFTGIWVNSPLKIIDVSIINTTEDTGYLVSSKELNFTLSYQHEVFLPVGTAINKNIEKKIDVYVYSISE